MDGHLNSGQVCPTSTLVQYVLDKINLLIPEGYKITWDDIVEKTPWTHSCLAGNNEAQILCQPIPLTGVTSLLELAMQVYHPIALGQKQEADRKAALGPPPRAGWGDVLKIRSKVLVQTLIFLALRPTIAKTMMTQLSSILGNPPVIRQSGVNDLRLQQSFYQTTLRSLMC